MVLRRLFSLLLVLCMGSRCIYSSVMEEQEWMPDWLRERCWAENAIAKLSPADRDRVFEPERLGKRRILENAETTETWRELQNKKDQKEQRPIELHKQKQDIVLDCYNYASTVHALRLLSGGTRIEQATLYKEAVKDEDAQSAFNTVAAYFFNNIGAMHRVHVYAFNDKEQVVHVTCYTQRNWRDCPMSILELYCTNARPVDALLHY